MQKFKPIKTKALQGSGERWFYQLGDAHKGPLSSSQLAAAVTAGSLPPEAVVWRSDIPVRVPAGCLPWLFPAEKPGAFDPGAGLPPEVGLCCPGCGCQFTASQALYVARDPRLPPDPMLHPGEPYRFLPARFTPEGKAIDPGGMLTDETACPSCHISLTCPPRPLPASAVAPVGRGVAVRTLAGAKPGAVAERLPPILATSEGIRELIAALRGLLSRQVASRTSGDQLAAQYAELCRQAAVRQNLCGQLMASGLREEAFRQAHTPPALSDLCALLNFPEIDDWRQLCARNRWAMPEKVEVATVARDVATAGGAPAAINAAQRALRHAVAARRFDVCVRLLHTLMLMDTENAKWREDAAAFEAYRQRELIEAGQSAISAGDLSLLNGLMEELTGSWVKPPAEEQVAPLAAAWRRLREADAQIAGRAAAVRFAAACRERDLAAASASAAAYEALVQSGFFAPDDATRGEWDAGQPWFRQACAENEAAVRLARDVAALEAELAKPEPGPSVDTMLAPLVASGAPLDGALRRRAEAAIAKRLRGERRRRLRRVAIRTAGALLALSALAGGVRQVAFTRRLNVWQTALTRALDTEDAAVFDRELERLRSETGFWLRGRLTGCEALSALRRRRDETAARQIKAGQAFAEAQAGLKAIEVGAFDDPTGRVPSLLAQARTPPVPAERQAWLDAYEARWRTNQTQRLAALLETLPDLTAIAGVFASQPIGQATQAVARLVRQSEVGRLFTGADAVQRGRLTPFVEATQLLSEGMTNRLAALQIVDQAAALAVYLDGMARYASRFERDWLVEPFDAVLTGREVALIAVDPVQDFLRRRADITESDAWMTARQAISDLHENKTLVDLRWVKRRGIDDIALVLGLEKEEPNLKGRWAPVYLPTAADIQPEFRRAMVLDSVPWGRGLSETPSQPFKHTEITRAILDKVTTFTRAEDAENYIEEQFRRVAAMPVWRGHGVPEDSELLNVCFKIQFLAFFAERMTTISPFPEWREILDALKTADDPDVSWVCWRHTRVRDVDRRGVETLSALFGPGGPAQRLHVRRAAQQLAAHTPLIWAGQVCRDDASRIVWRRSVPQPGAAAIIGAEMRDGKPVVRMLTLTAERQAGLRPGQPILAWSDGGTIDQRLKELAARVPEVPDAALPASLPEWFPKP